MPARCLTSWLIYIWSLGRQRLGYTGAVNGNVGNSSQTWAKPLGNSSHAVLFFSTGPEPSHFSLPFRNLTAAATATTTTTAHGGRRGGSPSAARRWSACASGGSSGWGCREASRRHPCACRRAPFRPRVAGAHRRRPKRELPDARLNVSKGAFAATLRSLDSV